MGFWTRARCGSSAGKSDAALALGMHEPSTIGGGSRVRAGSWVPTIVTSRISTRPVDHVKQPSRGASPRGAWGVPHTALGWRPSRRLPSRTMWVLWLVCLVLIAVAVWLAERNEFR